MQDSCEMHMGDDNIIHRLWIDMVLECLKYIKIWGFQ